MLIFVEGIARVGDKQISGNKITVDSNLGREDIFDGKSLAGQEASSKAPFILVKNWLYQNIVVTPKGELTGADIDEFLQLL